ncbi:N-acetylmuramic acid 6-phosphate etherase [Paludibaculum fermentans]|uniref:N-acetylmuramic acid 6-phosphate etherase n=1 Tax=Paludibaculum fermentans TaxID=1473598 RepID=UPI003EBEB634
MSNPPQPGLDLGHLMTEQINAASAGLDTLPTAEMLAVFNREDQRVALAVEQELPRIAQAVDAIADAIRAGGRLFYTGAGTSGRLGVLDASECPPTFNVPAGLVVGLIAGGDTALRNAVEGSEDSAVAGRADLQAHGFTKADVLVGIAASGRTPYVLGGMALANELGAVTIAIACSPDSAIGRAAQIPIEVLSGPEVVTGSTRLKAGTATKLVLNMLSTGAMVKLGYVYSNLMVNVQPTNEKLQDRAIRIVMAISGLDRAAAAAALSASGRDVRLAIVMGKLGLSREQAAEKLKASGGRVREAIG